MFNPNSASSFHVKSNHNDRHVNGNSAISIFHIRSNHNVVMLTEIQPFPFHVSFIMKRLSCLTGIQPFPFSCQIQPQRCHINKISAISVFISNPTTKFHVTETLSFLFQVSFIKNVCHTYKQKFCHSRFHVKFTKNVMFNEESAISFPCQIQPQ